MISAKVIADSKNEFGNRITTMVVTMPRIILAEFNTHRMFSRNSASSRAIPFGKMVESVSKNPFIPMAWQKDHKGMQGTEYVTDKFEIRGCEDAWLFAKNDAVRHAMALYTPIDPTLAPITKQLCNRLLEPFMWHTVIVTATEWENFFALRCPCYRIAGLKDAPIGEGLDYRSKKDCREQIGNPDHGDDPMFWLSINKGQAEIHMMALAEAMWDAYNESTPRQLKAGEWHIPFGDDIHEGGVKNQYHKLTKPSEEQLNEIRVKIATARCARVSYTVVGEEGREQSYAKDIELHDRLAKSGHWSPFEHCAQTMNANEADSYNGYPGISISADTARWSGNFRGFIQYRKMFKNENIS